MGNVDDGQRAVVDEGDPVVDSLDVPRGSLSVEQRLPGNALARVRGTVRNAVQQGADGAYAGELYNRGCRDCFHEENSCD